MKKTGLMFLLVVVLANVAMAGGSTPTPAPVITMPTDMKMITSAKALESYAKEQVARAFVSAGSSGVIMPGGKPWVEVQGQSADIREIFDLMAKEILSFRVLDPTAEQYLYASFCDNLGYELFFGSNQYRLLPDGHGGWLVPSDAKKIILSLAQYVPIYVPGVDTAFAVMADGQRFYCNIWDNRMFFPTSMAGMVGHIVVGAGNGSTAYDMATGEIVVTTPVGLSAQTSIKGLITLDDPDVIESRPVSVDGQGENPLYQIKATVTKTVTLSAETSEGELSTGVYVREVGMSDLVYFDISIGAIPLSPGVYDLWFVYPNFGVDEPTIPPYDGVGKG
ncbi:MAG: hypothetical protein NT041_00030 [Candidatus Vogelbacteria bacterium]|nr:hypothetical protein [Candidatus Vogelbacteria bacterium]